MGYCEYLFGADYCWLSESYCVAAKETPGGQVKIRPENMETCPLRKECPDLLELLAMDKWDF